MSRCIHMIGVLLWSFSVLYFQLEHSIDLLRWLAFCDNSVDSYKKFEIIYGDTYAYSWCFIMLVFSLTFPIRTFQCNGRNSNHLCKGVYIYSWCFIMVFFILIFPIRTPQYHGLWCIIGVKTLLSYKSKSQLYFLRSLFITSLCGGSIIVSLRYIWYGKAQLKAQLVKVTNSSKVGSSSLSLNMCMNTWMEKVMGITN